MVDFANANTAGLILAQREMVQLAVFGFKRLAYEAMKGKN